ncbi:conserved hypothetical protein [Chloroherpeton thalassium ATCC 35110]|uniref:Integral membrane bound transporter domain-containing protein n=1 Tax=Chloroherpeton thalassium (strain ATCC 35110 / GB-78) TaxID=517418 RepID=B3QUY0_CHLT3|nr:FUSC family protein [Chloroherpeton thalassium]ACF14481.1 conserved hypothetical protein [Chloroherpeton thalassium ATCC 35110]
MLKGFIVKEIKELFKLKKTERLWHIPVLAALCIGVPLLAGLYFDALQTGLQACLGGLVILYLPTSSHIANRMITLLACSFAFMVSFTTGLVFSFNPIVSAIAFGIFAVAVHWTSLYFESKPPGSFFFILIASMSSCMPFDLHTIPEKVGLVGLGTMFACLLGLGYSFLAETTYPAKDAGSITTVLKKNRYADFVEALIMGLFMFLALFFGHWFSFKNPYWIPISCAAVMQGATLYHIWQRSFQRTLGTFIGLGLCWVLLSLNKSELSLAVMIIVLQFIIEMLVVRHYALAVIFITPMAVLLAEAANPLVQDPNNLAMIRFWDIAAGSLLGLVGGWLLHQEKVRYQTIMGIRKMRVVLKNR